MTRVFSIFERIGVGGGGKVKAVYHRMNALAEMPEFDPVLLSLDHGARRKITFAELQAKGIIAPRVRLLTLPEALEDQAIAAGIKPFTGFPRHDQVLRQGKRTLYLWQGQEVMIERSQRSVIGTLTRRTVPHPEGPIDYTLIDGLLHQKVQKKADGVTETMDFIRGLPIRWVRMQKRNFLLGRNLITGKTYHMARAHGCGFFEMIPWGDSVVFFDGVTSAYLSPVARAPRVLYLHADHRGPKGDVVPRSRFLIENFKGEAIVTSTEVHKAQMLADLAPAAPIHVIPHFCDSAATQAPARRNLVTVSRLELTGKPIHECIEAFARIMHDFPKVDYLIYGVGGGQRRLEAQIAALGCGERVRLMGYTSAPLEIFRSAIAAVYPTMTEGFGLSILEALSNGCPVLSYDVNYGPREMILPGVKGELVPPGDIDAIASAMRRMLQDPLRYQRGTGLGLDRYTRSAYVENYRRLVRGLAGAGE